MMSAQRWRRRLPRLLIRPLVLRSLPLSVARRPMRPFSSCWISRLTLILLAFLRGGTTFWLCTGHRFAYQNLARGLRVHFTRPSNSDGRAARLPSRFEPQRASLRGCQMCAISAVIV